MKRTARVLLTGLLLVWAAGCIGTDFLDETARVIEPYIVLTPEVDAVEIGQTRTFEATYFDSTDTPRSTPFTWTSSDVSVARIDEAGVATGAGVGQARITASAFGVSREALLTVVSDPDQVARVTVSPAAVSISEGESTVFTASVENGRGDVLTDRLVTWQSSVDTLATIDANGNARGLKPGRVHIIASADGVQSAPAELEVLARSKSGGFQRTPGTSYNVAGTAILEQVEGGGLQVRFLDNFTVSNGPDLYVYLSTESKVNATSLSLGRLQSTGGAQTYTVPSGVRINDFGNVLIHCLPFNVTFGFAPLN